MVQNSIAQTDLIIDEKDLFWERELDAVKLISGPHDQIEGNYRHPYLKWVQPSDLYSLALFLLFSSCMVEILKRYFIRNKCSALQTCLSLILVFFESFIIIHNYDKENKRLFYG